MFITSTINATIAATVHERVILCNNLLISSLNASRFGKVFFLPVKRKAMQSCSEAPPS